jgi:CheY-like chemotaxis protein
MSSPKTVKLPRVLLIDDDAVSREVLAMMLEMHGFAVEVAEDGAEALAMLGPAGTNGAATLAEHPELILMDTQMPGVSGLELLETLRRGCQARIVAISGSAVSSRVRRAADGFLMKPVEVEELMRLLEGPAERRRRVMLEKNVSASAGKSNGSRRANGGVAVNGEAAGAEDAVIDPLVLGKLKAMMNAAALREVYTATAADLEGRLATLAAAMQDGQAAEVVRIAHAIKGGCAMVGLSAAKDSAARLETGNQSETWQNELSQLHFALDKLQGILSDGLLW